MARVGDGLDVVVDAASLQKGGGRIWLLGPVAGFRGERALIDFLRWEAPPWGEHCPLAWGVIPPLEPDGRYTLVVVCAPQVRLRSEYQSPEACSGCHYPADWNRYIDRIRLAVIRVLSPEEVPPPGERIDYGALLRTRHVDRANQAVEDPERVANRQALISITRTPLGIRIADSRDDWVVAVEAVNAFEPSLVDFSLKSGMPRQGYSLSQTDIVLRRTANTRVTGFQRYADQVNEIASFNQVAVWDEAVLREAPLRAGAPPRRQATAVKIAGRPLLLTALMEQRAAIIQLGFSMLPVIGEAIDIAELVSIALWQQDLQGEAAGYGQMALTAASLMTGPLLEGPENARRIGRVVAGLSSIRFVDATGTVSLAIRREMRDQVSPLQRAATETLSAGEQASLARALETAASTQAYEVADAAIQGSIRAAMDRLAAGPGLPAPLVADAMRGLHPGELLEDFATLGDDAARAVLDLYGGGARRGFDFDLGAMARIDAGFLERYRMAVDEAAVFRLLTPLGDDFVHPVLRQGFRDYRAGGGRRNATSWLANQSGRSRYRRILTDSLGNDGNRIIVEVMGRTARRRGYRPAAADIDAGVRVMEALEARRPGALLDVLPYDEAAELQRGFGHLLERDHLLEGRFWRHYIDGAVDYGDFWCVFAPKNAYVREELAKRGWAHFDYDHVAKTQRMRQLIPHGAEDAFTTDEIWMAHYLALVDVHVDAAARRRAAARFDAVVLPLLREMAESKGEGAFRKPALTAAQMMAVLAARRASL